MPSSWIELISLHLRELRNNHPNQSVILAGVGNTLMGDDAAGILVVQKLKANLPAGSRFIPIDTGPTPENFTSTIRRSQPGIVVFIDAGDISQPPGSVGFYTCEEGQGVSAFGHALPLGVLGQYLEKELGCECYLLIIQPARIDFDIPVSGEVQKAVEAVYQGWLTLARDDCLNG